MLKKSESKENSIHFVGIKVDLLENQVRDNPDCMVLELRSFKGILTGGERACPPTPPPPPHTRTQIFVSDLIFVIS